MISGKRVLQYVVAFFRMMIFDLKGRIKIPWSLHQEHRIFHLWHWPMVHRIKTRVRFVEAMGMDEIEKAARILYDM